MIETGESWETNKLNILHYSEMEAATMAAAMNPMVSQNLKTVPARVDSPVAHLLNCK